MSAASKSARPLLMVDMSVVAGSPAGSCVRAILQGVAGQLPVTLMSTAWDAPAGGERVQFVPVAAPARPVLLRYIGFHWRVAKAYRAWAQARQGAGGQAALTQATQGQLIGADIVYAHFCHGAYVPRLWAERQWGDLRFWLRMATHLFNARQERLAFEQAKVIVAPSQGLKRELIAYYGIPPERIEVIANPVDVARFGVPPAEFDRAALRASLGITPDQTVLGFMALGDFERKGLGLVISALADRSRRDAKRLVVLVVGGQSAEIERFKALAREQGVAEHVSFVGMQSDVRPYLWASDVFAFPSVYEIFSLAILQAAAAGLPVMVTQGLYGAEEFVDHGHNGWQVPRQAAAISALFDQMASGAVDIPAMGAAARASVAQYSAAVFVSRWQALYRRLGLEARDA
jgi:glycosyltransferase involved in cell wall biosynthesis